MSLEYKKLEAQLAGVRAARLANEVKVYELSDAIERINKDIQVSLEREADLEKQMSEKKGN